MKRAAKQISGGLPPSGFLDQRLLRAPVELPGPLAVFAHRPIALGQKRRPPIALVLPDHEILPHIIDQPVENRPRHEGIDDCARQPRQERADFGWRCLLEKTPPLDKAAREGVDPCWTSHGEMAELIVLDGALGGLTHAAPLREL